MDFGHGVSLMGGILVARASPREREAASAPPAFHAAPSAPSPLIPAKAGIQVPSLDISRFGRLAPPPELTPRAARRSDPRAGMSGWCARRTAPLEGSGEPLRRPKEKPPPVSGRELRGGARQRPPGRKTTTASGPRDMPGRRRKKRAGYVTRLPRSCPEDRRRASRCQDFIPISSHPAARIRSRDRV